MGYELYINQIVDWVFTLSPFKIYLIFTVVAYIENIIPPMPGDVLVAFGGYLAAEQVVGFVPLLMITTVASVFGFMSMYWIGAQFGYRIEAQRSDFWLMRVVDIKYFDRVKRWMQRWGQGVIVTNRFLAGTRSVISLVSGITKTKVSTTILSSTVSSIVWNFALLGFGWVVNENWQIIGHYLNIYGRIVLGLIVAVIIIRFTIRKVKETRRNNGKKK